MRQQDHHLGTLGTSLKNSFLQVFFLNAELPICHHVTRVGNRCVGKRLTNDGARHPVHFVHDIGLEHLITKVFGFDVVRHKCGLVTQLFFHKLSDPVLPIGELEVSRHDVHAQ